FDREEAAHDRRGLNQAKAKEVIEVTQENINIATDTEIVENHKRIQLVSNDFFTMVKWEISGTLNYMKTREFVLVSVLKCSEQVIIDSVIYEVTQGQNLILNSDYLDTIFEGNYELIISYL